jgi:hypothetical protein
MRNGQSGDNLVSSSFLSLARGLRNAVQLVVGVLGLPTIRSLLKALEHFLYGHGLLLRRNYFWTLDPWKFLFFFSLGS